MVYANDNHDNTSPDETTPQNILLILVDDLKPVLGTYGDDIAVTPEIDKLAEKSMRFDRAYSNQAVCAPSRNNLMLGSRSTSTGIYHFGRNFRDFYPDAVTLPQYFKENGYHTESMGKVFHVGHNTYSDQASWSRPHHHDKLIEYLELKSTGGTLTREEALFSNFSWSYARSLPRGAAWENPDVEDDAYADGRIAQKAIERLRFLKENPEKPFSLLWVLPGPICRFQLRRNIGIYTTLTPCPCLRSKLSLRVLRIMRASVMVRLCNTIRFLILQKLTRFPKSLPES